MSGKNKGGREIRKPKKAKEKTAVATVVVRSEPPKKQK